MMPFVKTALLLAVLFPSINAQFTIEPEEFYMNAIAGTYDAVIDVRTQTEWDAGHVSRDSRCCCRLCVVRMVVNSLILLVIHGID